MEGEESLNSLVLFSVHGTENIEDERELERRKDEVEIEEEIEEIKGEEDEEEVKQKNQPLRQEGKEEIQHKETRNARKEEEQATVQQDGATVQQNCTIKEPSKNKYKLEIEMEGEEEEVKQKNQPLPQEVSQTLHKEEAQQKNVKDEASEGYSPPLHIMIVGNVGVGKSTLINSMLGKEAATVSDDIEPTRHNTIEEHTGTVCGTPVVFYDTRGLGDPKLKNKELIKKFKQKLDECGDRLRVLICQRFTEKFDDSVNRFAEILAKYFKNHYSIWKNCILVLTKANKYDPDDDESDENDMSNNSREEVLKLKMKIRMKNWAIKFQLCLKKYNVPEEIIMNMPVCVAGKKKVELPLTDNWIESIMKDCLSRVKHFHSTHRMEWESQKMGATVGATVGGAFGGLALPLIGIPFGATIGILIGNEMAKRSFQRAVSDTEEKEFHERKRDELITKEKD
uniref:G domain-containing protein n=1 Tax=Amphimedon queenslandica TaxID=400682 RepID=A0A1X7TLB8_AMPQE